jgi:uncharacterized protein YecE (DUF72 family)
VTVFIGCAGWSIPKPHAQHFGLDGSHLARYATRFNAVEINSSFYKSHQEKTYRRWAAGVPDYFRFAVKTPKEITHQRRLVGIEECLARFVEEVRGLGEKLGLLLVQLPPSLIYSAAVAGSFFESLRQLVTTPIVCEPRHSSWFAPEVDGELAQWQIVRVAADPALLPQAAIPGGWGRIAYFRWHGSPRMYYSSYDDARLDDLARGLQELSTQGIESWCIFDNTAAGAATVNALSVQERLKNLSPDCRMP